MPAINRGELKCNGNNKADHVLLELLFCEWPVRKFQPLNIPINMNATARKAISGKKKESTLRRKDRMFSRELIIKFPIPSVDTDDAILPLATLPFIAAAVPPPAMIASAHRISSESMPVSEIAIKKVPAIPASGTEMVSSALSIIGM